VGYITWTYTNQHGEIAVGAKNDKKPKHGLIDQQDSQTSPGFKSLLVIEPGNGKSPKGGVGSFRFSWSHGSDSHHTKYDFSSNTCFFSKIQVHVPAIIVTL